jgi:L-alanine-DL-glutamate epimerase-like enolase superfamily enzyme
MQVSAAKHGVAQDLIESVDCYDCVLPLPRPLQVGDALVSSRSYVVVRLRTTSGLEGHGYAFGRGLPIGAIIREALVPLLVGSDARFPERVRAELSGAYWPYSEQGLFPAACSAVDLALWDLTGKRAGLPVADLLGRRHARVDACLVGGYSILGADQLADLEAEASSFAALGARAVKLTVGGRPADEDAQRVATVRRAVGDDCLIVADAFRSFRSLDDALRRIRFLEPYGLSYLEDPFSESLAPLAAELRRRSGISIGLGETLAGHRAFRSLIAEGCVDVVRCDATVVGGVREFMATAALASAYGLSVSTHVHPDVHVHFAAAMPHIHPAGLEVMLPESGLDAFHLLLRTPLELQDGMVEVPARPGFGVDFDWAAIEEYARG